MKTEQDVIAPTVKPNGLVRIWKSFTYSLKGLAFAMRREPAFQQQVMLFAVAVPLALWLAGSVLELALLLLPLVMSMVVELLNTAIECLADQIDRRKQELLGAAKDLGSAAVFLCLTTAAIIWGYVLWKMLTAQA